MIFTGIRATFSAPRSLVPISTFAGPFCAASAMTVMVFPCAQNL